MASGVWEVILPLYSTLVTPHLEQLWGPQHKEGMDVLEQVQRRTTKIIRGMEQPSYEERLKRLQLLSLEWKRLWGWRIVASYKEGLKKNGDRPFIKACSDRTKSHVFRLKRFRLEIKDNFFM